jgi:hypothetical protein
MPDRKSKQDAKQNNPALFPLFSPETPPPLFFIHLPEGRNCRTAADMMGEKQRRRKGRTLSEYQ